MHSHRLEISRRYQIYERSLVRIFRMRSSHRLDTPLPVSIERQHVGNSGSLHTWQGPHTIDFSLESIGPLDKVVVVASRRKIDLHGRSVRRFKAEIDIKQTEEAVK